MAAGKDATANVTVILKGDEAKRYIKGLGDETKKQAQGMKAALGSALSEGLKGGLDAVKGMASGIKSAIGTVGTLMGGIGVAELARGAIEAKQRWSDLGAGIRFAGGTAEDAAQAQAQAQRSALAWGQDSIKVADAFDAIRNETGSIDFAKASIDTVAEAARGAHKPLEQMSAIAGTLNEKFGVTAEDLPETLAVVTGLANKGGIQFEDMASKLGLIGAYAKEAGLSGKEGFGQMVGLMNLADNSTGSLKKGISAVGGLLEQLGTTAGKAKIGAALGISQRDLKGNAAQQIEAILRATKGQKAGLEKAFGGEQLKVLVDLGKTYAASFESTKGDVKTKTAGAVDALRAALGDASHSAVSWSDLQKEAAAQMQDGPAKIAVATERLRQAVAKPEVVAAIEKMLGLLPGIATFAARLVSIAAINPGAAITAAIVANIGQAAIGNTVASLFKSFPAATIGVGLLAVAAAAAAAAIADYEEKAKKEEQTLDETPALIKKAQQEITTTGKVSPDTLDQLAQRRAEFEGVRKAGETGGVNGVSYAAILAAKLTGGADEVAAGEGISREARKLGQEGVETTITDLDTVIAKAVAAKRADAASSGPTGPAGSSGAAGSPVDLHALAAATTAGMAAKEIRVRVVNAAEVAGGGGPTASGNVTPGWKPR